MVLSKATTATLGIRIMNKDIATELWLMNLELRQLPTPITVGVVLLQNVLILNLDFISSRFWMEFRWMLCIDSTPGRPLCGYCTGSSIFHQKFILQSPAVKWWTAWSCWVRLQEFARWAIYWFLNVLWQTLNSKQDEYIDDIYCCVSMRTSASAIDW